MSNLIVDEVLVRARALFGLFTYFTPPLQLRMFFEMELRSVPTDVTPAPTPFEHRGTQYLTRRLRPDRTARALIGAVVPHPSDAAAPCLPVCVLERLCAQHLILGELAAQRVFARFNISPAALAHAEDVAAAAGLDFSPATLARVFFFFFFF